MHSSLAPAAGSAFLPACSRAWLALAAVLAAVRSKCCCSSRADRGSIPNTAAATEAKTAALGQRVGADTPTQAANSEDTNL
jgi:hypothetical protein